jgi:Fe2+ transport system protein FeoA
MNGIELWIARWVGSIENDFQLCSSLIRWRDLMARAGAQPLSAIRVGATARIDAITTANPRTGRRLQALGFVPGSRVAVLRRAPLGDPVEYEVRGTRVCLRASEAVCIRVVPD